MDNHQTYLLLLSKNKQKIAHCTCDTAAGTFGYLGSVTVSYTGSNKSQFC